MGRKTIEDLEEDGFEILSHREKNNRFEKKSGDKSSTTIVAADNTDVLKAIAESNLNHQQSSEIHAKSFQHGIEKLVKAIADKPDSFTLDIERDERGFMKRVNVTINK